MYVFALRQSLMVALATVVAKPEALSSLMRVFHAVSKPGAMVLARQNCRVTKHRIIKKSIYFFFIWFFILFFILFFVRAFQCVRIIIHPIWTNMAVMMGRTVNNRRSHEEVQGQERQEGQKL